MRWPSTFFAAVKPEGRPRIPWRHAAGLWAALGLIAIGSGLERRAGTGEGARGDGSLGLRSAAADFAWIGAQAAWERQDPVATTAAIRRAVTWDPDRRLFWINGARMIAYDLAAWRIARAGGAGSVPVGTEQRWRDEQALQALAHLAAARVRFPDDAGLLIEQGNIELWARGNLARAADAFGLAASLSGAPAYALRLEVGLLRRLGRADEALRRLEKRRAASGDSTADAVAAEWIVTTIELLREELEGIKKE